MPWLASMWVYIYCRAHISLSKAVIQYPGFSYVICTMNVHVASWLNMRRSCSLYFSACRVKVTSTSYQYIPVHCPHPCRFLPHLLYSVIKGVVIKALWLRKVGVRAGCLKPVVTMIIYRNRLVFLRDIMEAISLGRIIMTPQMLLLWCPHFILWYRK